MPQRFWIFRLFDRSPSSRRAWIEISAADAAAVPVAVALLAEGVDRNFGFSKDSHIIHVALLAEGVDRNFDRARAALQKQ